jgi:hypothetical protein
MSSILNALYVFFLGKIIPALGKLFPGNLKEYNIALAAHRQFWKRNISD